MTEQRKGGRWKPGQSGNPAAKWKPGTSGNPEGQRTEAGRATLRKAIHERLPAIIEKLVELAEGGDVQAARTLLERVLPPIRPEAAAVDLPALAEAATITEQGAAVIAAVARGEIAPDTAGALLSGLAQQGKLIETDELRKRIEALEEGKPCP